jgi:hypothetical protein
LLPKYPDLLGLIDLIEDGAQTNCRYLRLLRDLFNKNRTKREFATQILQKHVSKDAQITDLVASILPNPDDACADMASELDLINLPNDFSAFDTTNITQILMNAKSDYQIRKSCLEQLTMLLFDQNKKAKVLFTNYGVIDVFSFVVQEVLQAFNTAKSYCDGLIAELPADQQYYLEQCLKFLGFAYIFFADETVVRNLFDGLRIFNQG